MLFTPFFTDAFLAISVGYIRHASAEASAGTIICELRKCVIVFGQAVQLIHVKPELVDVITVSLKLKGGTSAVAILKMVLHSFSGSGSVLALFRRKGNT